MTRNPLFSLALSRRLIPISILAAASIAQAANVSGSPSPSASPESDSSAMHEGSDRATRGAARNRLEELFIWKVSEDLKLPAETEQKFSDIVRAQNSKRRETMHQIEESVHALGGEKTKAESEKAVASHRKLLVEAHNNQMQEFDQLRKLLGPEKMARYLVLRGETMEKLRSLMSQPRSDANPATNR